MSDTLTVETDGAPTRRPMRDRPERQVHAEPTTTIDTSVEHLSPEDALAESRQLIQEKDRDLAASRRAQQEAEQRRQAAESRAAQTDAARQTDRSMVVSSALQAAQAEQAAARQSFRLAREAGDIDAEAQATETLSSATYRVAQASAELEWLKNQPKQPAQPTSQPDAPSEAAQRWLSDHPAFYSDEAYRSTAEGAHNSAVRAGKAPGSPQYIDHIEGIMTRVYGEGHGQDGSAPQPQQSNRREPMSGNGRQQPRPSGAPPSRGATNGSSGGWKTVNTLLGPVQVQDRQDGTRGIRFTSREQQENFDEGARLDRRYSVDPSKMLAEYTNEQVTIAMERAAGGTGDLVQGDGGRFE